MLRVRAHHTTSYRVQHTGRSWGVHVHHVYVHVHRTLQRTGVCSVVVKGAWWW